MKSNQFFSPPLKVRFSALSPSNHLKEVDSSKTQLLQKKAAKGSHHLLIDYGAYAIKAGWSDESALPQIIFRPLVNKTKDSKHQFVRAFIPTSSQLIQLNKNYLRSPYDRNVIVHYGLLQHCNDYIFSQSGHNCSIVSPLAITEPIANCSQARTMLLQQFFQCYRVPLVFLANSPLLAYFYHLSYDLQAYRTKSAILIQIGSRATHIVPIFKGKIQNVKRINVGQTDSYQLFQKSMLIKFPAFKDQLKSQLLQSFYQQFCFVAWDFKLQLKYFMSGKSITDKKVHLNKISEDNQKYLSQEVRHLRSPIQLQFQSKEKYVLTEEQVSRKQQIRKRMGERLREAINRKRKQKQDQLKSHLQQLQTVRQLYDIDPQTAQTEMQAIFGVDSVEKLDSLIRKMKIKLKIQVEPQIKVSYTQVPDHELTPEQLRLKRIQNFHKQAAQTRQRKKQEQLKLLQQNQTLKRQNLPLYITNLYQARAQLKRKIEAANKMKVELADRNSSLNQRRLQTLAKMVEDQNRGQNYGFNDEDWQTIRFLNTDEDEDLNQKIMTIELQLRELDPQFDSKQVQNTDPWDLFSDNQSPLLLNQLIRGPQVIFQPSLVGCHQMGLADTLALVLKNYSQAQKKIITQNIVVVGGGSKTSGLAERLSRQMTSLLPPGSQFRIHAIQQGQLASYWGLKGLISKYPEYVKERSISRPQFMQGHRSAKQHMFICLK